MTIPMRLVGLVAVALAAGCGKSGPTLHRVTGHVTFKGQAVPNGRVLIDPDAAAGNDGPQGYAPIVDGTFDTARGGRGTLGGAVRVRVEGRGEKTADFPAGVPLCLYTQRAELPAADSEQNIDVPARAVAPLPPTGVSLP